MENLFNPFHQADGSITRKYGGTGLGLTISRLHYKKMKETIAIKSELGVGSCFTVTFPIHPAEVKINNPTERKQIKLTQSLNILLVEDSPTNQLVARLMLERRGHQVTITNRMAKKAILKLYTVSQII